MTIPSTTADNGRDCYGRFAPGNKLGRGNPFHRRTCALRSALLNDVTGDDVGQIIAGLVRRAKSGDVIATRELLDRTIGDAVQADLLQRVEALEQAFLELGARFHFPCPRSLLNSVSRSDRTVPRSTAECPNTPT